MKHKSLTATVALLGIATLLVRGDPAMTGNSSTTPNFPISRVGVFKRVRPHRENAPGSAPQSMATCNSPLVSYFDGPLISNVHIVPVFWNSDVNSAVVANMAQFYSDAAVSNWYDLLSEYSSVGGTDQSIGRGDSAAGITITPSICPAGSGNPCALADADVQNELINQIQEGQLPAPQNDGGGNDNTLYAIHFPANISLAGPGGILSCADGGFCAYHSTSTYIPVAYTAIMDEFTGPCAALCGNPSATALENTTSASSHELAESVTDTDIGLFTGTLPYGYPAGWGDNDNNCGEIADICDDGSTGYTITVDGRTWAVQQLWSNRLGACVTTGLHPIYQFTNTPTTFSNGNPFGFTLTALDPSGNKGTDIAYAGTVHFTSTDPAATLPSDYTFTSSNSGTETFTTTLDTGGFQTITATDTLNAAISASVIINNPSTITVNNTSDPASTSGNGFCTLREAINNANSAGTDTTGGDCVVGIGDDVIVFSVSGTITLAQGALPAIAHTVVIDGTGQTITVDGANLHGVLVVNAGATLHLNLLTIARGKATTGAGVSNNGTLTVNNSTLSGNVNGAIFNNNASAVVTNSTFSGNTIGISNGTSSSLSVTNSTFSGNTSGRGGAIFNQGQLQVSSCSFSGNTARLGGAAIYNVASASSDANVTSSIFARSTAGGNCAGLPSPPVGDGGYNVADDATCDFFGLGANGDSIGDDVSDADIALGTLANNGGPTQTIALESGSYAIDAVPLANCPATDQRGGPRPEPGDNSGACDVGAFESGDVLPTPTASATATSTATASPTASATLTATPTVTATPTATATATATATPTTSVGVTASLAFGDVSIGQTVTKNLTVRNIGATHSLIVSKATPSDPEYVLSGGTCGSIPIMVPPETSCTLGVAFTPTVLGSHSATIPVYDDSATSPQNVALTGTGIATMTVTPASFAIGDIKVGFKAIKAIVVHNYQPEAVSLSEGFSGPNAGDFSITGGTCTGTLAARSVCTLLVTFAPTSVGTESAPLTVTDSPDALGPYTVSFGASATVPESLSAPRVVFGNVYETASRTLNITVTNKATSGSITLTGTTVGGANSGDFAVTGGSCTGSLAASSSCTYAVMFTPSIESAESGTLSIGVLEDPNGGPPAVGLSGTGLTALRVVPGSIAFGTVAVGHSSIDRTVTVINDGGAAVSLSESITGDDFSEFAVTGGTCGSTLAGDGAHCTYLLNFTPSIGGTEDATLGVSAADDAASPHNVSLGGTGS